MNARLKQIQNWHKLVQRAKWNVGQLAKLCGVSVRTLERYFLEVMGVTPAKWIREQRLKMGAELIKNGNSTKATASEIGYKYSNNFSRAWKNYRGVNPLTDPGSLKSEKPIVAL